MPTIYWLCPNCGKAHDDKDSAAECCQPAPEQRWLCEECKTSYGSLREAIKCELTHNAAPDAGEEEQLQPLQSGCNSIAISLDGLIPVRCACGDTIGYTPEEGLTQMGAICGNCAVTRPERAALDEIADLVRTAMDASDLSKLDLKRILELCGKEEG